MFNFIDPSEHHTTQTSKFNTNFCLNRASTMCLESCDHIEALILILRKSRQLQIFLWPHHQSDTASHVFSCWGTENSQMVPNINGEYGGWSTSSKPQSCIAAIATTDLRAGALPWWNNSLHQFSRPFWNVSCTGVPLFKVLNYLSSVGSFGRKQCSLYYY